MALTVEACEALRRELKPIAEKVGELRGSFPDDAGAAVFEALANVTIAYRALEDASMRLGKAIQALDGGRSVYDKTQVPGAAAE